MWLAVDEINLASAYLLGQDDVSSQSVGVMGFCMGGGLSLAAGASGNDAIGAVIAFYGTPLAGEDASQVTAPVLGLYGSEDGGIPVEDVRAMESALEAAGVENDINVYDGAQHAFFNDTRESSYDADAAADAWQKTLAWLRDNLA